MGERYLYMVCRDGKIPSLIRLGSFARMEADLYAYPGVWKDTPHLNDIRVGKGCFMDYDDVSDEEAEEIRLQIQAQYDKMAKVRVYIDMDGVLADFDRGVRELCHMEPQSQNGKRDTKIDDLMWDALRKVDHYYDKLELMPGAKEMFDLIYWKYGDQCEILTGVPRPERGIITAGEDKIAWTKRNLSEEVKINIVLRKEKLRFCKGPDSVLIDDRAKTIRDWKEAGGIGILHTSPKDTLDQLRALDLL